MPFGINDKEVVAPFGVNDIEEEAKPFGVSDVAVEEEVQPTPTQPTPPPTPVATAPDRGSFKPLPETEPVDLMGLGITTVASQAEDQTAKRSYATVPEVAKDKQQVTDIRKFLKERYPNMPVPAEDIEAVKLFSGTLPKSDFDIANDLNWALNATDAQKAVALKAFQIGDKMPTSLSGEVVATLKSPSTYVGGVAAFGIRKAATTGVKRAMSVMIGTAGVEGFVAAGTNIVDQKGRLELGKSSIITDSKSMSPEERAKQKAAKAAVEKQLKNLGAQQDFSYAELALSVGVSAGFGALEGKGLLAASKDPNKQMAEMLAKNKKTPEKLSEATETFLKQFKDREGEIYKDPLFASAAERESVRASTLDKMDAPKEVTNAVLNKQTIKDLYKTAEQLFRDDPTLLPQTGDSRSITQLVIDTLEEAGVDNVQQAAKRAGIDEKVFLETFKVTLSEAGTVMQNASALSRVLGKMVKGQDPELDDAMERIAKGSYGQEYLTGTVMSGAKKLTDASVGAAVASLSTTILNTVGLVGAVTVNTLVDTMEATIKHGGKLVGDMRGDVPINKARVKETSVGIMEDSMYAIGKIFDSGYSSQLYDTIMGYNPRLNGMLLQTSTEGDRAAMGKFVTLMNTANRAVETFVRKPMLIANLQVRMRDVGLNLEDFVANNKAIPPALIEQSVNDTLALTFSSGFRKTGEKSFEGFSESTAASIVKTVNENTLLKIGANIVMPFYRFGLNSIRYSYRLTPMSSLGGMKEMQRANVLNRQAKDLAAAGKGKEATDALYASAGLAYEGRRKVIEGMIGTGIIAGAMMDRSNNADLPFYQTRNSKGEVSDISTLAPISFVYALAESALIMKDLGQSLYYTMAMSPEDRAKESLQYKQLADATSNTGEKQDYMNKYELLRMGRIRDFDGVKFTEILAGYGRMAGTQKTVLDNVKDLFEEGITLGSALRGAGTFAGDFVSRFDNVLNPLYDIFNLMNDDFTQKDSRAPTTMGLPDFVDAAVGAVSTNIPVARDILQDKPSLFTEKTPRVASATRYLTGERPLEPVEEIQNEALRLNIEPYKLYKRSGDRTFDNILVQVAGPELREAVKELLSDPDYKDSSKNEQVVAFEKRIGDVFSQAKDEALNLYAEQDGTKVVLMNYKNMPKKQRQAAEDRFVIEEGRRPETMEDMEDILAGDYSYAKDIGSFASGGLVSQTNKLLSR